MDSGIWMQSKAWKLELEIKEKWKTLIFKFKTKI